MRLTSQTLWLTKNGNAVDEYEDAFSQAEHDTFDVPDKIWRYAVADGATEASFAGIWAKLLTDGYCAKVPLDELRLSFATQIQDKDLSWFAEEKAGMGAFAAYLGLELTSQGSWTAEAIGDCCLFHVRHDEIVGTFPILGSVEFTNSPRLVSSSTTAPQELPSVVGGRWSADDEFFLVSDALAKWMMESMEAGQAILPELRALKTNDDLAAFVAKYREPAEVHKRISLRNDDVTLMSVQVG